MNNFLINILILSTLLSCKDNKKEVVKDAPQIQAAEIVMEAKTEEAKDGFLFINISNIYHNGGQVIILNQDRNAAFIIKNKLISIDNKSFDIIEEEHLYKDKINVESFFPEYGLFIIKSKSEKNGVYEVQINGENHFINNKEYADLVLFKSEEQYVLDAYPNISNENPLRVSPDEKSTVISDYENYTYLSVEISGDWLKVRDDKDCYPGEAPSEKDIIGWVRWKKDGKIIIDIRHIC